MNDLRELLGTRATQNPALLFKALHAGLSVNPGDSGLAAGLHALLQGYVEFNDVATMNDHRAACLRYPGTARALIAILEEDGEHTIAGLLRSLLQGRPQPTGALQAGLHDAVSQAAAHGQGVEAALKAFADVALQDDASATEMELSLGWSAVEEGLIDRVADNVEHLAFRHGEAHRQAHARALQIEALAASTDIGTLLNAMAQARGARIIAQADPWAVDHEAAPATLFEVPVRHQFRKARPGPSAALNHGSSVAQLRTLYEYANGAELFIPVSHEPAEAGLVFIPDSEWDTEREIVMTWLTMGDEQGVEGLPTWVRTLVPFAVLSGDASRWVTPIEGPYAGTVMLSNQDVMDEHVRYSSIAHFIAALRLCPQEILGNGGYVSYVLSGTNHALYPVGYREDA